MSTYYLSPTGNDTTGDGSSGNPWLTVQKAVTAAAASGDTIICKNGTYTHAACTFNKNITVQAETSGSVIMQSSNAVWSTSSGYTVSVNGITFSGITGAVNSAFQNVGNVTYTNCSWIGCTYGNIQFAYAIFRGYASSTTTLTACIIRNTTRVATYGVGVFYNDSGTATYVLNSTNLIFNVATPSHPTPVFSFSGSGYVLTTKNCIIYNSSGSATSWRSGTATDTSTYCDFYLMTTAPTGTGVITSDPLFVDAANLDFRLRPTSPCVNAGTLV